MKKLIIPIFLLMTLIIVPFKNVYATTPVEYDFPPLKAYFLQFKDSNDNKTYLITLDKKLYIDSGDGWFSYAIPPSDRDGIYYPFTVYKYDDLTGKWTAHTNGTTKTTITLSNKPITIISANYDVKKLIDGVTVGETLYTYVPPTVPSQVTIIRPSENYTDTVDGFEILTSFKFPINTNSQLINIKVYVDNVQVDANKMTDFKYTSSNGEGYVKYFITPISVGAHNVKVDINGIIDTSSYTRLGGVVDENGDGIDDRTNLPIGDGHVEPVETESTWQTMVNALNGSKEVFSGIVLLCSAMFLWIPTEIRAIVLLAVTITFIIMLKKLLTK